MFPTSHTASLPRPLQGPLGEKVIREPGMVLDLVDRELRPVVRFPVLHLGPMRGGQPVDHPDVSEGPAAINVLVLIIFDLEMDPEVLCHVYRRRRPLC